MAERRTNAKRARIGARGSIMREVLSPEEFSRLNSLQKAQLAAMILTTLRSTGGPLAPGGAVLPPEAGCMPASSPTAPESVLLSKTGR